MPKTAHTIYCEFRYSDSMMGPSETEKLYYDQSEIDSLHQKLKEGQQLCVEYPHKRTCTKCGKSVAIFYCEPNRGYNCKDCYIDSVFDEVLHGLDAPITRDLKECSVNKGLGELSQSSLSSKKPESTTTGILNGLKEGQDTSFDTLCSKCWKKPIDCKCRGN